jgi:hypothetical protein
MKKLATLRQAITLPSPSLSPAQQSRSQLLAALLLFVLLTAVLLVFVQTLFQVNEPVTLLGSKLLAIGVALCSAGSFADPAL